MTKCVLLLFLLSAANLLGQDVAPNRAAVTFPFSFWKSGATPTPTPSPTPTATPSPTATPTPTASPTPTATPTATPSATPDPNPITRTYVTDGDANGILYFAGQNFSTAGTWTNPHTAGRVVVVRSSDAAGTATDVVDRAINDSYTNDVPNSWVSIDLGSGRSAVIDKYSLRNRSVADRAIRNWKLQGSNDAVSNSTTDLDAATWDDLDVHTADTTMASMANQWATFTLGATPSAYRWLRIIQTGPNADVDNYLTAATEIELYGDFSY